MKMRFMLFAVIALAFCFMAGPAMAESPPGDGTAFTATLAEPVVITAESITKVGFHLGVLSLAVLVLALAQIYSIYLIRGKYVIATLTPCIEQTGSATRKRRPKAKPKPSTPPGTGTTQ